MERGVVIGGLMIFGSFLLAALLNRSAMEESPPPAPAAPVTAVAPIDPPDSEAEVAPGPGDCSEVEANVDTHPTVAPTEPPSPDRCSEPE